MLVQDLTVQNFRNISQLQASFNPRLNIIIGDNGQGKTNIIEAIFLLLEGESFRYSRTENLISLGQGQAFIRSEIHNKGLDYKVSLRLSQTNGKKEYQVNGKNTSVSRMAHFSAVLFSPESLNVIKESSDERRQLADQLVAQTSQAGAQLIQDYRKVLKTRNRLLKDMLDEKIDRQVGLDTLQSLNVNFLKLAVDLTASRLRLLNDIKTTVEQALNDIHLHQSVKFDFDYVISEKNHRESDLETLHNAMQNRLSELQSAELKSGLSLVGPQKHDVIFLYNGNDSRFYCSQGQQRSIILAYKMAQIVYHKKVHGFYPLLLLDDVLSELDLHKQESLISTLNQTETQTFVTTTDVSLLSKLSMNKASVFKIKNGQITV
jgi:DNA replication and repair protein RecF